MRFKPLQQLNTILEQEYLEPTISWAIRVVLALNVPLLIFPLFFGFSYHLIWTAFGAYLVTLIDYRGTHYRKMLIQFIEAIFIFIAAIIGMNVGNNLWLAVAVMFIIGIFAAIIRNWSDYGSTIGVGVGFFYLFGISNPQPFGESIVFGLYTLIGAFWAIAIVFFSFPFSASNPVKRSIGVVWKKNTEYLDSLIQAYVSKTNTLSKLEIAEKELNIRKAIDQSIDLFARRKPTSKLKAEHYDQLLEIRKTSSKFGASLMVLHEDFIQLQSNNEAFQTLIYKTVSALAQASARMSIALFTFRAEDLTLANVRATRYAVALNVLKEYNCNLAEKNQFQHLIHTLEEAQEQLEQSLKQISDKLNFKRSDYLENYKLSLNHFISGLRPRLIAESAKEMFNFNSQQFAYALRVGLGLAFSVWIYKFFQIDHGHWIALTMLIVIQPYYGATRKKGLERSIGTVTGIIAGGVVMLLPLPREAFFAFLVVVSFLVAYFLRNNYKLGVFFVTIMMVVMMQITQQGSWELIGFRLISTLIGVAIALLASIAFWPVWESQRFPTFFKKALTHNRSYFSAICLPSEQQKTDNWHKIRRVAEAANNDVFNCIQRMYEEPKHINKDVENHFAQVGSCIRITREITSLGVSLEDFPKRDSQSWFAEIVHLFDSSFYALEVSDFTQFETEISKLTKKLNEIKTDLSLDSLCSTIQLDLEKIAFELRAIHSMKAPKKVNK